MDILYLEREIVPYHDYIIKERDVFEETNPLFIKKTLFEENFPMIKEIKVKVKENGDLGYDLYQKSGYYPYNKSTIREFVKCHNPICINGGVSIGRIVRNMVYKKEDHKEVIKKCQGFSKRWEIRKACINSFCIIVDIEYFYDF